MSKRARRRARAATVVAPAQGGRGGTAAKPTPAQAGSAARRKPVARAAGGQTRASGEARAQRSAPAPRTRLGQRAATRPKPVWHPIPATEIGIGGGLLLFVVGLARGSDDGSTMIGAGVLLATLAVIELCAREHFSGFRSHVLLLAFLPVVALHTAIYFLISDGWRGPIVLLVDLALFGVLSLMLLDQFRRRQRAAGRR